MYDGAADDKKGGIDLLRYGFFDSEITGYDEEGMPVFDRAESSDFLAMFIASLVSDGVLAAPADCFQVLAKNGMTIEVRPGFGIVKGRFAFDDDPVSFTIEDASKISTYKRIDRVVLRANYLDRKCEILIKQGEPAVDPIPAKLIRIEAGDYYEMCLAEIRINSHQTVITQANITDTRYDSSLCGVVTQLIDHLNTSVFFAQLNSFYNEFVAKSDRSYQQFQDWQEDTKEKIEAWRDKEQKQTDDWQAEEAKRIDDWQAKKKAEIEAWQAEEVKQTDDWQKKETDDLTAWMEGFINQWESWLLGETKGWQEEIIDWFNNLREQLTENAAVSLQEQIGNLNNLKTENKENLVSSINSICMSYEETMAILAGVKTLKVTLSMNDGTEVPENIRVSLYFINADGKEKHIENKMNTEGIVTFEVYGGMKYKVAASGIPRYNTTNVTIIADTEEIGVNIVYKLSASLADLSWEEIYAIADRGKAGTAFKLYDTKEIELTTGEKVVAMVVGLGQDISVADAENTTVATFIIRDYLRTKYRMNQTNTNIGGWKDSEMRTKFIRENFYDVLPQDLKERIKLVNKKTSVGNKGTSIVTTEDYVWLPSPVELGIIDLGEPYTEEGMTYTAFTERGEATAKGLRTKKSTEGGNTGSYWLRSPVTANSTGFKMIGVDRQGFGIDSSDNASVEAGMAVGFCL